jgi:hypothetical protein
MYEKFVPNWLFIKWNMIFSALIFVLTYFCHLSKKGGSLREKIDWWVCRVGGAFFGIFCPIGSILFIRGGILWGQYPIFYFGILCFLLTLNGIAYVFFSATGDD